MELVIPEPRTQGARHPGCHAHDSAAFALGPVTITCSMARISDRSLALHAWFTHTWISSSFIESLSSRQRPNGKCEPRTPRNRARRAVRGVACHGARRRPTGARPRRRRTGRRGPRLRVDRRGGSRRTPRRTSGAQRRRTLELVARCPGVVPRRLRTVQSPVGRMNCYDRLSDPPYSVPAVPSRGHGASE